MSEAKTFMEEYFPLTSMAIEKAMKMNDFPGGNYHVESYTIEIDDHSPIYDENFPGVLQKFEHIVTMAKRRGVRFSGESMRERSYGQIIEEEFRSRVVGRKDESDSYPVSVRTSLTVENYGEAPNLVIFIFVYNKNFITESYHNEIAAKLDVGFSTQLIRDIERMHALYVSRMLKTNDERYINSFSRTAVEYMLRINRIATTGILGNIVAHAVLDARSELIYPLFQFNDRGRLIFVDKRTTDLETLTKAIDENIETSPNHDDDKLIQFLLGDAKMVLGYYVYEDYDNLHHNEIPVCLIDCLGTSNEEISEISIMLRILNENEFFERPGATFNAVLVADEDKKTHSIQLIDDAEDLEAKLNRK